MKKYLLILIGLVVFPINSFAQEGNITVNGVVIDEAGLPIPGVNVIQSGSTNGVVANFNGEYSIEVPSDAVLLFSYVGFSPIEVAVDDQNQIDVTMQTDVAALNEIIVVGYGTQRKATLTGSVTSIETEEVESSPTVGVANALTGLLPGLTVSNRSGAPGEINNEILIRGRNTTGDNSPLVVVDGVQNPPGWQRIPSSDIESISVLKDASAAIYGARAANGVILITTKKGAIGKPVISYSFNQGISTPTRLPEMASSALFAEYVNDLRARDNQEPAYTPKEIQLFREGTDPNYPSVNWYEEVLKDYSLQSVHNLSLRGGTESVLYSVSGSYSNQNSIFKGGMHEFNGYTLRSNLDADITENIGVHVNLNAGLDDRLQPGSKGRNPFGMLNAIPMMPVYYPGGLPSAGIEQGMNPAVMVTDASGSHSTKSRRIIANIGFDAKIPWIDGLGLDGYFVHSNENVFDKDWRTPWTVYNVNKEDDDEYIPMQGGGITAPELSQSTDIETSNFLNMRITYEKQFEQHYVNAFIGAEQKKGVRDYFSAYRRDYLSSKLSELFAGNPDTQQNDGLSSEVARRSLLGRLSYNYEEKYIIDINARYDGSYIFAKGNRYGFFPGVSVAWVLSDEDFLQDFNSLTQLKLRASTGKMGNDKIAPYQHQAAYSLNLQGYHFGFPTSSQLGIVPGVLPNPDVTWEVATAQNIGLDASFWRRRLDISVDLFKQKRENILTTRDLAVPAYTGIQLPDENIGIIENKGIEFMSTYRSEAGSDFSYAISGNIAYSKNNVIEASEASDIPDYQRTEGAILGAGLYYEALGIFRTEEELNSNPVYPGTQVGDLQYRDVNDDGIINATDRVRINKSNIPEVTFGFNTSMSYGNFSLFANFAGQAGAWQYYHQNARNAINGLEELIANRYTPGSMDSKYPILPTLSSPGSEPSGLRSTFWLQNAAFVRLKTLQLGYTLPESLVSRLNLSSARIYLNGNNLFTISEIKWFDPEGDNERGSFYPQNKIFNIGIELSI